MKPKFSKKSLESLSSSIAGLTLISAIALIAVPPGLAHRLTSERVNPAATSLRLARADDAYTLGAGDRVRIEVFKLTQYSGENQVLVDGTLNLPEVGNVSVEGMTLKEASQVVSARYAKILRYPIVTVSLLAPRPVRVGISGEVNRPGSYTLPTTEGSSQLPTVTRALQLAGGITLTSNLREVEVRRPRRFGADQIIKVNLWAFLDAGDVRQDITLRSGDSVFIPTLAKVDLNESVKVSSASFAADRSQPLNIAIVGEVYRPGPYIVTASARTGAAGETGESGGTDRPPTVTRAIQVAGGIKPQANIRQIQVRRPTRSGVEQIIDIDLWKLLKEGDLSQDLILQDRDTVVVPTALEISAAEATQIAAASFSPDSIRVNVAGEVKQPGVVRVAPNTPLNQAILAAGGFNIRARKKSVELIRLNPDGTVTRREVRIDFTKNIDEQANPALRNDDIVVVNRSGLTVLSDNLGAVVSPVSSFLSVFSLFTILRR